MVIFFGILYFFRPDNADIRLTELTKPHGAITQERWEHFSTIKENFNRMRDSLMSVEYPMAQWARKLANTSVKINEFGKSKKIFGNRGKCSSSEGSRAINKARV